MGTPVDFKEIANRVIDGMMGELTDDGWDILATHVLDGLCQRVSDLTNELDQVRARRADAIRIIEEKRKEIHDLKERVAQLERER